MTITASPAVTPAVVTASASVLVAAAIFTANQIAQLRNERRQSALTRVSAQLRDLYGPLYALVEVNEHLWRAMRSTSVPDRRQRRSGAVNEQQNKNWSVWLYHALMPVNIKMRDAILLHADLVIDNPMPPVLTDFCSHVASYEVMIAQSREQGKPLGAPLTHHPGEQFVEYVRDSFSLLKEQQVSLLRGKQPKR